jgi:hypothetical protein
VCLGLEFNEFVRHCGIINDDDRRTEEERKKDEEIEAEKAELEAAKMAEATAADKKSKEGKEGKEGNEGKEGKEGKEASDTNNEMTPPPPSSPSPPSSLSNKNLSTDFYPTLNIASLGRIFASCNIEKDSQGRIVHDPKNSTRELLRFEFLESLVRLAVSKYGQDRIMANTLASEKVELLMKSYVQDYASTIANRSMYLRERLSSHSMLEIYHINMAMIKRVYKTYCIRDNGVVNQKLQTSAADLSERRKSMIKNTGIVLKKSKKYDVDEDKTISFDEFRALAAEAHLIDERINLRVLKTIYVQSMQFSYSTTQTEDDQFRTSLQQVFIEFLEALARLGIAKYGDDSSDGKLEQSLRKILKDHLSHLDPKRLLRSTRS